MAEATAYTAHVTVWTSIRSGIDGLPNGRLITLGRIHHNGRWQDSSNNSQHPALLGAIRFFAENHLQMGGWITARIGRGLKELPQIKGFSRSLILLWQPDSTYARIIEAESVQDCVGKARLNTDHDDWTKLRVIQLLASDVQEVDVDEQNTVGAPADEIEDQLSTIPEEDADGAESQEPSLYLKHSDAMWQEHIDRITEDLEQKMQPKAERVGTTSGQRLPLNLFTSLLTVPAQSVIVGPPMYECDAPHVELAVYPPMTNTLDLETRPGAR